MTGHTYTRATSGGGPARKITKANEIKPVLRG